MLTFDRSTVKHGTQNIQNYCHQWLSVSFVHQIRFRPGLRPRPHWGAYSAPPYPLAGLRALLLRGGGQDGEGKGREKGERKGTKGTSPPPFANSSIRPNHLRLIVIT